MEGRWPLLMGLDGATGAAHLPVMTMIGISSARPTVAGRLGGFAGACLLVALATLAGLLIAPRWGTAPVVLLYLPAVLAAAVYGGFWPAVLAALAATLAFNYYFTAPYHTFRVDSWFDLVTMAVLLLVGLVTSRLAGSLRDHARLAEIRANRNSTIAGFARRLLSCRDEQAIAEVAVAELARLFECHAVLVSAGPRVVAGQPAPPTLEPSDMAAVATTLETGEATGRGVRRGELADWQFRPVSSEAAVIAAVGIARDDGAAPIGSDQVPLLQNLLDQVALALDRARLEQEARDFVALRERDRLRSALLVAIGEDVKPRVHSIGAAARAMRRSGSGDKALAQTVINEAGKLDRYIDNLVDLSPGGDQTPVVIGPLTIDFHRRAVVKDGEPVHLTPKEYAVLAELAKHAGRVLTHVHLLRSVWGPAQQDHIDYLRVAVRGLRQKLETHPDRPELILNEPAVGYRLAAT